MVKSQVRSHKSEVKSKKSEVKIKICGITNLEDAKNAVKAGCDALGFVFYKKSPRYIRPDKARQVICQIPSKIKKIGVFVNAPEKEIRGVARLCQLDLVQFHGQESPEFCRRFKNYKVIKAFRVKQKIDLTKLNKYKTFAYLFDAFSGRKFGGTGRKFNWHFLKNRDNIKRPFFLSGGLNARNVGRAITCLRPDWVDLSSSVEIRPGKKDYRKIQEFIRKVKGRRNVTP